MRDINSTITRTLSQHSTTLESFYEPISVDEIPASLILEKIRSHNGYGEVIVIIRDHKVTEVQIVDKVRL